MENDARINLPSRQSTIESQKNNIRATSLYFSDFQLNFTSWVVQNNENVTVKEIYLSTSFIVKKSFVQIYLHHSDFSFLF
mgnify:CR=1 FL=1